MFTGIIQGKGKIVESRPAKGGMVFCIEADFDITDPEEGESIAINGVCLTAYQIKGRRFYADVSPESLSRTNLGKLTAGGSVNLERALRLSDRLGGHLVSGHIDGVTHVTSKKNKGGFTLFSFSIPEGLGRYIIEKGSVTIDGISLTVNSCDENEFSVSIIPHSMEVTNLGQLNQGSEINLEVDIIGKYVEKLLMTNDNAGQSLKPGISAAFLAEYGFLK